MEVSPTALHSPNQMNFLVYYSVKDVHRGCRRAGVYARVLLKQDRVIKNVFKSFKHARLHKRPDAVHQSAL